MRRYNVHIEDVTKMINTALGGEPVGTLYEGERRSTSWPSSIALVTSPQAIGRLPVYTPDGVPIPLEQVTTMKLVDGQTLIARENSSRPDGALRHRRPRSGRLRCRRKARFEREIELPAGYHVEWLGMFENLARARTHFLVLMPVTIGLIFVLLWVTSGRSGRRWWCCWRYPSPASAACWRFTCGMHLNMSSAVGFTALFGVAIMDGVLMVRWISTLRVQGLGTGRRHRRRRIGTPAADPHDLDRGHFRPVAGLPGHGLGSDVQRPLATVIVWGLFSSTTLTLFVVPVFYRIIRPSLPQPETSVAESEAEARCWSSRCPTSRPWKS